MELAIEAKEVELSEQIFEGSAYNGTEFIFLNRKWGRKRRILASPDI